ncbi:MAG: thiamine pyrophosphate-binding protein, partial [Alloalcanivorax xenomutans]
RSGRPGPVHLDIPCDVGTQLCRYDLAQTPPYRLQRPVPCREELQRVAAALRGARRPLLIAGGGVARSGGVQAFRDLVAHTDMLAMTTANGRGVLDPADANTLGSAGLVSGQAAIDVGQEADLVLAVGCKFSTFTPIHKPPHYPKPDEQKIIQIEIDAESIGRAVPVEIGLVGDARATLEALLALLAEQDGFQQDLDWKQSILKKRDAGRALYRETAKESKVVGGAGLLNESAVAAAIGELLPRDAIVVHDGGQTMMWTISHIQVDSPERSLFVPGMGHLGFGLPYANAAKLAHPERAVFCLTGDGAMGMTIQELETASRYGLAVIVVVFNDSYWGMYKPFGEMLENPDFGTKLSTVDFAAVARGFGCYAEDVSEHREIPAAVQRALDSGRPAVLNIGVDFTPHPVDVLWANVSLEGVQFPAPQQTPLQAVA